VMVQMWPSMAIVTRPVSVVLMGVPSWVVSHA